MPSLENQRVDLIIDLRKFNYLKDKMRNEMRVHILLNNLASFMLWKSSKLFLRKNNSDNRFDLVTYMFGFTIVFFIPN